MGKYSVVKCMVKGLFLFIFFFLVSFLPSCRPFAEGKHPIYLSKISLRSTLPMEASKTFVVSTSSSQFFFLTLKTVHLEGSVNTFSGPLLVPLGLTWGQKSLCFMHRLSMSLPQLESSQLVILSPCK